MKLPLSLSHTPAGRRLLVALALFGLCLTRSISQSQAAGPPPMIDAWPIEASAVDDFSSGIDICTPPIAPVTLSNPTIVTNCTQAGLQTALNQGGQIAFDCGPNPVTINISSPLATSATKDTVIDGGGLITLDGGNSTRILEKPFTPGSDTDKTLGNDLTLQNIRFINAKGPTATGGSADRGGAITATSPGTKLHIINSTFENDHTASQTKEDNQGGAIFAANIYETIIVGSVFENNSAGNGGAFGAIASGLIVYNSRFIGNDATDNTSGGIVRGHGGAIHLDGVTNSFNPDSNKVIDICGSTFEDNTAIRGGGAIKTTISDNKGTKATYTRSTFTNNRLLGVPPAEGHGGAIYHIEDDFASGFNEDNLELSQNTFSGNEAYRQGGGVWYLVNGLVKVENNTFYNNRTIDGALGMGGALVLGSQSGAPVHEITNNTFAQNYAWFHGGGIQAPGDPTVKLTNNIFYYNESERDWANYQMNRAADIDGGGNFQFPRERFNQSGTPDDGKVTPSVTIADPLLAGLADNGGFNRTMALQAGSPAIDTGAVGCPGADQRNAPRVGNCDIGAFEYNGVPRSSWSVFLPMVVK
ncbi:MAG: hypothetical protein KDI62_18175 [Anaerolineae bacterium]|nr:hypothetical protein [Anaerolineae bacterium]